MDFVTSFPNTLKGHDAIWVIVDRLKKSAHFIPINISFPVCHTSIFDLRLYSGGVSLINRGT